MVRFKQMSDLPILNGRVMSIPLAWYPALAEAPGEKLENYEISSVL